MSEKILRERTYLFLPWLSKRVAKFPKDYPYALGNRLSSTANVFLEGLIHVFGGADARALRPLSKKLDILRYKGISWGADAEVQCEPACRTGWNPRTTLIPRPSLGILRA